MLQCDCLKSWVGLGLEVGLEFGGAMGKGWMYGIVERDKCRCSVMRWRAWLGLGAVDGEGVGWGRSWMGREWGGVENGVGLRWG